MHVAVAAHYGRSMSGIATAERALLAPGDRPEALVELVRGRPPVRGRLGRGGALADVSTKVAAEDFVGRRVTMDAQLLQRLKDARGNEVVFVSHCLLDENVRYLGGAFHSGAVPEMLPVVQSGVGIYQMPCPEWPAGGVGGKWRLPTSRRRASPLYSLDAPSSLSSSPANASAPPAGRLRWPREQPVSRDASSCRASCGSTSLPPVASARTMSTCLLRHEIAGSPPAARINPDLITNRPLFGSRPRAKDCSSACFASNCNAAASACATSSTT